MQKPSHGNGSGKFEVGQHDMGGWVRICAGRANLPDDLPVYLSQALSDWFRQRPHLAHPAPWCADEMDTMVSWRRQTVEHGSAPFWMGVLTGPRSAYFWTGIHGGQYASFSRRASTTALRS